MYQLKFFILIILIQIVLNSTIFSPYQIQFMRFEKGVLTSGPGKVKNQSICVGNNDLCSKYSPNLINCFNKKKKLYLSSFECEAELKNPLTIMNTKINCVQYPSVKNVYYTGSCYIEYSIGKLWINRFVNYIIVGLFLISILLISIIAYNEYRKKQLKNQTPSDN